MVFDYVWFVRVGFGSFAIFSSSVMFNYAGI